MNFTVREDLFFVTPFSPLILFIEVLLQRIKDERLVFDARYRD